MRSDATTVDGYLAEQEPERRTALATLRRMILETAPGVEESMKYGHPHYALDGPLFALGAQKHHLSLYIGIGGIVERYAEALGKDIGKGCIRFRRIESLPLPAVREVIRAAYDERRGNRAASRGVHPRK